MKPRVLCIDTLEAVSAALKALHASLPGVEIMAPKAIHRLLKVTDVDARAAHIIKQEMLSKGGEAATPWELLKQDTTKVDVILMGTLRQYEDVCAKLALQPFGLKKLAAEIRTVLADYDKAPPALEAGRFTLDLAARTHIMGILNVTPDSFSDSGRHFGFEAAVAQARRMVEEGADIIDIGGESTRPGAEAVSFEEELSRVIPVIEALADEVEAPISIDTYKPAVAQRALDAGALLVNDVSGLRDPEMLRLVAERRVPAIIMHMKGTPRDMQQHPTYEDVTGEVADWLYGQAELAIEAGVPREKLLIDPGVGFGKTLQHNLELLRRLSELKSLGYPIVLGTSRKSFIGAILDLPVTERLEGTLATLAHGITQGAHIVRVHDVKEAVRVVRITDAIIARTRGE